MGKATSLTTLALQVAAFLLHVNGSPTPSATTSAASSSVSVTLSGVTYVNKGLVGFGLIPSDFRESTGDTMGGIGSAIALKLGTWNASFASGVYTGTFEVHPDRGYNVITTIDYQARQHEIDFIFTPYYGTTDLGFTEGQQTLQLNYRDTILQVDRNNVKTSGLDAEAVRSAQGSDPQMPIATVAEPHLTLDIEGIVANADGTYWISDEYGPYIYQYAANGQLIQAIQPPAAILPFDSSGALNFTSVVDPATGRAGNQGFEGLTLDSSTNTLYAMLQSATIQDGGSSKGTSRYTRLVAYDVSTSPPPLVGEWVVPLPQDSKGNTIACSEIHFVSPNVFLALSRDGSGRGGSSTSSSYKQADLFSISKATDIHGSKFDSPSNPLAKKGKLDSSITPATYVSFVNFVDSTQLAKLGLHNGDPDDSTLIDAKWESLAIAPVGDPAFPDDFFLFTASDNDFISTNGVSLGVPFNAGLDVDNQFLVFRVTLPGVSGQSL